MVYQQKPPGSNGDSLKYHPLDQRTMQFTESVGAGNIAIPPGLLSWYTSKNFVQKREAMERLIEFYHKKCTDLPKVGYNLPKLVIICLYGSTSAFFFHSQKSVKVCCEKFVDIWLEERQKCLHVKLVLKRLTFVTPLMFANGLLE